MFPTNSYEIFVRYLLFKNVQTVPMAKIVRANVEKIVRMFAVNTTAYVNDAYPDI